MKNLNKMIGTIMKETGFNYEFIVELPFQKFVDLYLECCFKEKRDYKVVTKEFENVLKNVKRMLGNGD